MSRARQRRTVDKGGNRQMARPTSDNNDRYRQMYNIDKCRQNNSFSDRSTEKSPDDAVQQKNLLARFISCVIITIIVASTRHPP